MARLRNGAGSDDGARVTLGMAVRGPDFSAIETCVADWALARELGLPVTVHVGGGDALGPPRSQCVLVGHDRRSGLGGSRVTLDPAMVG